MPDNGPGSEPIYKRLPVGSITPSPHQARKNFSQESLESLGESLREEGQLQAITVRPAPATSNVSGKPDGERYELISGERRWRAAQLLGWTEIDCRILPTVSEGEAAAKGLLENLQREDLDPIEEALGFKTLLDLQDSHWTQEQLSKVVGKDRSYISRSLSLLGLPGPVLEFVRQRTLTREHIIEIARIKDAKKMLSMATKAFALGLSAQDVRRQVDQFHKGPTSHMQKVEATPRSVPSQPPPPATHPEEATVEESESDPLEVIWAKLQNEDALARSGAWAARFRADAWTLQTPPFPGNLEAKQRALSAWFSVLAACLNPVPTALQVPKSTVPAPEITEVRYVEGNKLALRWKPLGEGFHYRIMKCTEGEENFRLFKDEASVTTPGAILNMPALELKSVLVAVIAVSPKGEESALSQPVVFELKSWNTLYEVLPIANS